MVSPTDESSNKFIQAGALMCNPRAGETTDPYRIFTSRVHSFWHFIGRIYKVASRMDETLDSLSEIYKFDRNDLMRYSDRLTEDRGIIGELLLTRTTDAFLTYVSRLLGLLFREKPEILQNVVTVPLAAVLNAPDKDSIIGYAVDKYVQDLSYKSLRDLYRDIKNKCDFQLFTDVAVLNTAVEAVGLRNVIVHNNSVVDERLARDAAKYGNSIGHVATQYNALDMMSTLILAAFDIDTRARAKWGLPQGVLKVSHECHIYENDIEANERRTRVLAHVRKSHTESNENETQTIAE
ncbi:hypothetical protein [Saccharothrix sp. HUAS TT1]|uniref:hypothetical protein n=1 Tax=unclassified Saccharothrix TaxID=2593673 RepID=UPI00345C5E2D